MKAYKVTDENMMCRGYRFTLKTLFKTEGLVIPCQNGFHFCKDLINCFNYYDFNPTNRVFEIEASGIIKKEGGKHCSEKIEFIKELSWEEVLRLVNIGKGNTGKGNSGDFNSGDFNSGLFNTNEPTLRLFNKETDIKLSNFKIPYINLPLNEFIFESIMTIEEKESNPNYKTLGGYLKTLSYKEAWKEAWSKADDEKRQEFLDLPNFDKGIFKEITGVEV